MIFTEQSPHLEFNTNLLRSAKVYEFKSRLKFLAAPDIDHLRNEIHKYYDEFGWGLKIVARNVLGVTYSNCRTIFTFLDIPFRQGRSVTTKFVADFRKKKAEIENEKQIGFRNPELRRFAEKTTRGVQGYYYNKSTSSYVWLRSSYEYIYAKFLNKIAANWKTEQQYYMLSDATKYSPDFYLYDENWNLTKIVEIKGYFDCRAYKAALLKEDYFKETPIDIVLINDISLYLEENITYNKELTTWKLIRKSKESV